MPKELAIITEVQFNKQDIVTVALARAESHIRKQIKNARLNADKLAETIETERNNFTTYGAKSIPQHMNDKLKVMKKAAIVAKLGKDVDFQIKHTIVNDKNHYHLSIFSDDSSWDIVLSSTNLSKFQQNCQVIIKKLLKTRINTLEDGVRCKAQLGDMDAYERQMRAKVVESELKKTVDGKAILDILLKDFEDTIKQIEM